MTRYFFVDVNIPADEPDDAMAASQAIEDEVGPADTGFGFGWRDMQIECSDEVDQQNAVEIIKRILLDRGYPLTVNDEPVRERTARVAATIVTRSADPEEDEADEQAMGLIPPGYEE